MAAALPQWCSKKLYYTSAEKAKFKAKMEAWRDKMLKKFDEKEAFQKKKVEKYGSPCAQALRRAGRLYCERGVRCGARPCEHIDAAEDTSLARACVLPSAQCIHTRWEGRHFARLCLHRRPGRVREVLAVGD